MDYPGTSSRRRKKPMQSVLVALLFLSFAGILCFAVMRIRYVDIQGNTQTDAQTIIELSGVPLGEHVWKIDLDSVRDNIQQDPRFGVSDIQYEFPSTLRIELSERKNAARIRFSGQDILVDQNGIVLEVLQSGVSSGVPQVLGLSVTGYSLGQKLGLSDEYQLIVLREILELFYESGYFTKYALVDVSNPVDIKLLTYSRVMVRLGQVDKLEDKLSKVQIILDKLDEEGVIDGVIDASTKAITYRSTPNNEIDIPSELNNSLLSNEQGQSQAIDADNSSYDSSNNNNNNNDSSSNNDSNYGGSVDSTSENMEEFEAKVEEFAAGMGDIALPSSEINQGNEEYADMSEE